MIKDDHLSLNAQGGQTVAATDASVVSTNSIDLDKAAPRQIGDGADICMRIRTITKPTAGTSVQFQLVESAATGLTTPTILAQTAAIAIADLVPGYVVDLKIPPGRLQLRHLGVIYVCAGAIAGGVFDAGIWRDDQQAGGSWAGVDAEDGF